MPEQERAPRVVAVVLNWKDPESTTQCVDSLLTEAGLSDIVVVDNESTGDLRSLGNLERVTLLEENENLGFSKGMNVGLRHAFQKEADAVFVINNDAVVQPGCVELLVATWRREGERLGLAAPVIVNPDGSTQSTGGYFRPIDASTRDKGYVPLINYVTWACVLLPRSTFEAVGLLDERFFMYWEDVDYGLRTTDVGLTLTIVPGAQVVHEKSKSHSRAGAAIERYSARGLTVLCLKRGGVAKYLGLPFRLTGRCVTRIAKGATQVRAVCRGFNEGKRELRRDHLS